MTSLRSMDGDVLAKMQSFFKVALHDELGKLTDVLLKEIRATRPHQSPQSNGDAWDPWLWRATEEECHSIITGSISENRSACNSAIRSLWSNNDAKGYALVPTDEHDEEEYRSEFKSEFLRDRSVELENKQLRLAKALEDLDDMWARRRAPLASDLEETREASRLLASELQLTRQVSEYDVPAPGPSSLNWVDSEWFSAVCNLVVALNVAAIILRANNILPDRYFAFELVDNICLVWYVFELSVNAIYRQRGLFVGDVCRVWWNWLDLGIVLSGVLEQWCVPIVKFAFSGPVDKKGNVSKHFMALRALRFLRLFRLMRVVKLLRRGFLITDRSWVDNPKFEAFVSVVISVNALTMAFELDYESCCSNLWNGLENVFLVIYSFELFIKVKVDGYQFFLTTWNILDFTIVVGGMLDSWFLPTYTFSVEVMTGKATSIHTGNFSMILNLLRMMRLLRILRLARLVREIKPLYGLLIGVAASLRSMEWVLVLVLLMLYAGAIVFTMLIGKGYLYGGVPPDGAVDVFGSVPQSLFSLFRLMNGDVCIVAQVCHTVMSEVMYMGFMVIANWAVLAILTGVVSNSMIITSHKAMQELESQAKEETYERKVHGLKLLFRDIDLDGDGEISEKEWNAMFEDRGLCHAIMDASSLSERELQEMFKSFAYEKEDGGVKSLKYGEFLEGMRDGHEVADKLSVLRIMASLRVMEARIEKRMGGASLSPISTGRKITR